MWYFDLSNTEWTPFQSVPLYSQLAAINASAVTSNTSSNSSNITAAPKNATGVAPDDDVPRLFGHSIINLGPLFVVFGGFSRKPSSTMSKAINQLYSFNYRQGLWSPLQPPSSMIPAPRAHHAHAFSSRTTIASSLVVFGGIGSDLKVCGDAWVIPLNLFQARLPIKANATDRMISFDFNCHHVSFDTVMLKYLDSFSVSFWIFANVIPQTGQFLIGSASPFDKTLVDFSIYAMPRSCTLQVSLNVGGVIFDTTGKASICDIGWHHVTFTYNGASQQGSLYVDGLSDAQLTVTAAASRVLFQNTFYIGQLPTKSTSAKSTSCWSGFFDRFSFWNVSLTSSQVAQFQFNASSAYFQFDFDSIDFSSSSSKGNGMIQAVAYFGSGNVAQAPALLPSSCPISPLDFKFKFSLSDAWAMLPSGPSNRSHAMMIAITISDIVLFGGRDALGLSLSDLWILRSFDVPALAQWELIVPVRNLGSPMSHGIISTLGHFQVAIVGYNSSGESQSEVALFADVGGYEKFLVPQYFNAGLPPSMGLAHCRCINNINWAFGGKAIGVGSVEAQSFDGLFFSDMQSPFVPVRGSGFSPPPLLDSRYCAVNGSSMLLVGRSVAGVQNSYLFTLTSQSWKQLNISPLLSLTGGSLVSVDSFRDPILVAFGGHSADNKIDARTIVIYLNSTLSYAVIVDKNAPNRTFHGALAYGGMKWIFGGQTSLVNRSFSNELWTFRLGTLSWERVQPASSLTPPPIISHTFHAVGKQAVVVGGQKLHPWEAAPTPNLNVWTFDFTTQLWSTALIPNFSPCVGMSAASHNRYLYVYGGLMLGSDEASANMWITDTTGNVTDWKWQVLRTVGPDPRSRAYLGVMFSSLVLYGGFSASWAGSSLTDMWQFGINVADPQFSRVFGPNSQLAYAGSFNYFDIELRNVFNQVIGSSLYNSVNIWLLFVGNSTRFRATIEHRPDTIRIIFNPQYVGAHQAFLELNQGTISLSGDGQPFTINVVASKVESSVSDFHLVFSNGTTAPVDSTLLVAAGDSLLFEIICQDRLNNPGEYLGRVSFQWFKVKIVAGTETTANPVEYLDDSGMPPVEITASGGGPLFITGMLLQVANYSCVVKMGNSLVGGATYNFTLLSASLDPQSSLVLLEESTPFTTDARGMRKHPVGETVRIVVLLRDRFGNNITYALEDNFLIIRITGGKVPLLEAPEGQSSPLAKDVQSMLSASSYENAAFSLVLSDIVIEGLLQPKRNIRFFPFSLGDYNLHLATADGQYLGGTSFAHIAVYFIT